jgi:hypothetical protein
MKMPKLRVTRKSDIDLVQSGTVILNSMMKNADRFPDSAEVLAELATVLPPYAAATQAVFDAKAAFQALVASKNANRKAVEVTLARLANQVAILARDDSSLIHVAGMAATNDPRPVQMTQVEELRVTPSAREGELLARWKPVRRAHAYEVQVCNATGRAPANWVYKLTSTKARCALNHDLVSGSRVWVRVRAIGTRGAGAWSPPIRKTVP